MRNTSTGNNSFLRDYQLEMKARLYKAWERHDSVMVQMPTGTGKTHLLASVVHDFVNEGKGGTVWIIAHRRELVEQIEDTLKRYGIKPEDGNVSALSIQWLARHREDCGKVPDLIIIDEAHHALAETYAELWKRYPGAKKLGMTATPCRMSRKGFTDLFSTLLTSDSIADFIRKGKLALFDYISIRPNSEEQRLIDSLEKRGADGDYQIKEMNRKLNHPQSIAHLYHSVERFAPGKKGIVYAISISHSRQIAEFYTRQGLEAAAIDSKTPAAERQRRVEDFRKGIIKVLVNVDVFNEGFDCPDVEFIQMARPTLSLAKYLQQVGRGLRKADGKENCVLIDNVGLYRVFGLPTTPHDWESHFRGTVAKRKTNPEAGTGNNGTWLLESVTNPDPYAAAVSGEMEVVMTHDRLMQVLEEQPDAPPTETVRTDGELKAYHDGKTGLWGLKCGQKTRTDARFAAILDISKDLAAVRFDRTTCGVVDETGKERWRKERVKNLKFLRGRLLEVALTDGKTLYADLENFKLYPQRPVVRTFGGFELLMTDGAYHTRTDSVGRYEKIKQVSEQNMIRPYGFYLTLLEKDFGYACILKGDSETVYRVHRWMPDGSIVVKDRQGRFYHAAEGKDKRYLGRMNPAPGDKDCEEEMKKLEQQAERKRLEKQEERRKKRMQNLKELTDARPFCTGRKWGLEKDGRVIVPPVYRNVKPPVGKFCAVEMNYSQWGIIAVDGRVIVEPKYAEVSIERNGTAVLTSVTGKKERIKLS